MGINKTVVSELYEELKESAKEAGLNIRAGKKKHKQRYKIGQQE